MISVKSYFLNFIKWYYFIKIILIITTGIISQFVFAYVSGASTVVQTTTTWKIGFTLADKLLNPWKIVVTYPNSDFTISSCTPTNGVGFTTASTTCSVSGNTITITGTYDLAAGTVSFEGLAGTNPNAVITIGSFTARSYNTISGTDYAVDVYNADSTFSNCFTATAQTLTSVSVAINTPATYSYTGLSNVQYDFTVGHQSTFYSGYQVTITIPSSSWLTTDTHKINKTYCNRILCIQLLKNKNWNSSINSLLFF